MTSNSLSDISPTATLPDTNPAAANSDPEPSSISYILLSSFFPTDITTISPITINTNIPTLLSTNPSVSSPQTSVPPHNGSFISPSAFYFLVAGIPILFVAGVLLCCVCTWSVKRANRKDREVVARNSRSDGGHGEVGSDKLRVGGLKMTYYGRKISRGDEI